MTLTTQDATAWWTQHTNHAGQAWVERYWEDWQAPHREHILGALSLVSPVASLFEVGCSAGPNLRLIRHHLPHVQLSGQDLVPAATKWVSTHLDIPTTTGRLPMDLAAVPASSVDVALSCYTLAYLDAHDVWETVDEMARIARRAVILLEPMGDHDGVSRHDIPEWQRDYQMLPWPAGWRMRWRWPILPPVQALNACAVFTRGS